MTVSISGTDYQYDQNEQLEKVYVRFTYRTAGTQLHGDIELSATEYNATADIPALESTILNRLQAEFAV
ncbi:hypothetical protein [Paraliobacillus salinarum]|uniref:hypothetical protein n=1 Tax=Paraliobacillus salinarum TaxID=1158996 RepID=UPI0015F73152|nr:hypothetical protein [Paraliobacillus salinarum]